MKGGKAMTIQQLNQLPLRDNAVSQGSGGGHFTLICWINK